MTTDLAIREISPEQFDLAIAAAQHKAKSLKGIVDSQDLSVTIGTSQHLKVEAWLTIAAGYGYSPRIAWSRPVGTDGGYEAKAELVDGFGTVIAAGEAECGTEGDDNWLDKPAFQKRSMAQTRATVRACRQKLAWVVVLAGYSPTPAEEMVSDKPKGATKLADPAYFCQEHQTPWFKRGKMKNYAHPVKGALGVNDTGEWCNMPSAKPQDSASATPEPAVVPPPGKFSSIPPFMGETLSDLWNWAMKYHGYKSKADCLKALGLKDDALIGDLQAAAAELERLAAKA